MEDVCVCFYGSTPRPGQNILTGMLTRDLFALATLLALCTTLLPVTEPHWWFMHSISLILYNFFCNHASAHK